MRAAAALGVAAVYFAAAKLSLSLATLHPSASPVWPPTGIALAAVLLGGYGLAPGVFAGAFLANLTTAGSWATSLGIAAGNTGEALLGAWLVTRHAGGRAAFTSARGVVAFVLFAGLAATAVSASVGVLSLLAGGFAEPSRAAAIWVTWWLGDATGAVLVAPLLLLARGDEDSISGARALEAAALAALLAACGLAVFLRSPVPPLGYLCIPPVLWAAYRFGPREAAAANALLAAIALWGSLRGTGPWPAQGGSGALTALQGFFATLSVTGLVLAAVAAENRRARAALEARLRERTASLEEASAALAHSYDELEAFNYTVSHDLRAPLRKIIGFGDLVVLEAKDSLNAAARDHLQRMRSAALAMTRLVDALLELASFGRSELQREEVDAAALCRELAEELAEAEPGRVVGFSCRVDRPVNADRRLLRSLLQNLLSNAWKFTRDAPLPRVEVTETVEGGRRWIHVRDNGAGFAPHAAERLFIPFSRLHTSGEFPGLGIGLATAKRVVQRHGGRIRAEGAQGAGADFSFTL